MDVFSCCVYFSITMDVDLLPGINNNKIQLRTFNSNSPYLSHIVTSFTTSQSKGPHHYPLAKAKASWQQVLLRTSSLLPHQR